MPELVLPTTSVQRSFLEAMDEFVAEGAENTQTSAWIEHNAPGWTDPELFERFVDAVRADAEEDTPRPDFHVPCTTLWWVDGEDYLGRIAIRHRLNDFLLEVDGHAAGCTALGARPGDRPRAGHLRRRQPRVDPGDRGRRR
jgi:predicted acetyltransferase